MKIKRFQVYGERCSGTNFIIRLLEQNLTSARFTEEFGFKHWFVPEDLSIPEDTLAIAVSRSPEDSLRSLHRKQWHTHPSLRGLELPEFLETEWHCVWDDEFWGVTEKDPRWKREMWHERDPSTGLRFENVRALLAAKFQNWENLLQRSGSALHADYDTVCEDPQRFVAVLCEQFQIDRRKVFSPIEGYKGLAAGTYKPKTYRPLDEQSLDLIRPLHSAREGLLKFDLQLAGTLL